MGINWPISGKNPVSQHPPLGNHVCSYRNTHEKGYAKNLLTKLVIKQIRDTEMNVFQQDATT